MDNFFYDRNKKLKDVLDTPKSEHKQLNEGAKPDFLDVDRDGNKKESFKKAVADKKKHDVDEGMFDSLKAGMAKAGSIAKKVGSKTLDTLGHGSDEDMIKDLQKKMGVPQTGKKPRTPIAKEEYGPLEEEQPDYSAKKARAGKDIGKPGKNFEKIAKSAAERYGSKERGEKVAGAVLAKLRAKESAGEIDEGWDDMMAAVKSRADKPKVGSIERGHKHDIEHTATGRKVTRRVDPAGISVGADDDAPASGEKRGRGRPKGPEKAPERVTGGATKHKGGRKMAKEDAGPDDIAVIERLMDEAFADGNNALGNALQGVLEKMDGGEKQVDEKAVSKKQQRFMGMVHAAQKGEKPASKEVAKTAKEMPKKEAEKFAATKHKGLPEKAKSKKEQSVEETADDMPKASTSGKGLAFGKGIYDSINLEVEKIIAESMSINASTDTEGNKSITVSASDEDATKLVDVLRNAGLGLGEEPHDEQVEENAPDWPTDEVESDDALQYAGGLNKPKTTVAGDGQTTVPVTAVQVREESEEICEVCEAASCNCDESVEESLARFRSLAGIQEASKPDYIDLDKDGDKEESMKQAAADKKDKQVEESIFNMTNMWKAYKG